ncbi:type 2 isopentenyl-diphosphate Delta-isomerase [Paenibacillus sp. IB182496]|uniref:Isopentenyl-diphosphate delta-isomerase n=1 Tax=Paenibacillus sabuli TaxID=2772509 RepID=A0A927GUN0_9BACL|nr:type 2 isopentenyl-diphosphate Delta-isomerase [Paenibacillus sabuli]MBD2847877.1 type 2 isopentenyl-diphosphate Delta-isomerase [Paenibacillus sabuli]
MTRKEIREGERAAEPQSETARRKAEHIAICLDEEVQGLRTGAGFEQYRFRHNALPELDFAAIDLSARFLGRPLRAPLLVSSMTGGTSRAHHINRRLAAAAQRRGWAMGLGSVRAALESPEQAATFRVRDCAPDVPLLANLGAVQLNYGYGAEECRRAVELTEADALVLHLNSLQEVFQPGGDANFAGLLAKIERLCRELPVPVGVKEVGWGIDGRAARQFADAGVAFVDVAGAGGTSWSEVEKHRSRDDVRRAAASAFADWGVPTTVCIREARAAAPGGCIIGSGGIHTGVDCAKAIALGADLAGLGRSLLAAAVDSEERLDALLARIELELRAAMLGIGAVDLAALRGTDRLVHAGSWNRPDVPVY